MRKPAIFAALAVVSALSFAAPAAQAGVMGEGDCDGLGIHAAWLDWGTGKVSVAVFNHTGDGRWPARTLRFRVAYAGPVVTVASTMQLLKSLKPVNVLLFDYKRLIGADFGKFDGAAMLSSGQITLIDCAVKP